jgi:hypothetical protein
MKKRSLAPWLLALVCFGPVAAAVFIYYGPLGRSWLPQLPGSRELLEPSVPLPQGFRDSAEPPHAWQLIYARMTPCEQSCAQHLDRLRQVRLALGPDSSRVRRVLWHVGSVALEDPQLLTLSLDDAAGRGLVAALAAQRMTEGRVYVADPRGEVILSYPPDVEQKELLRDLDRLLTGSN